MELDLTTTSPVTLTANIYAATGLSRGSLLATASETFTDIGQAFYDVGIGYSFSSGADYDIEISWSGDTPLMRAFLFDPSFHGSPPFDVGPVRVVDGEHGGSAGNHWMGHFRFNGETEEVSVPEPGVLAIFGLGLAVLGYRKRNSV